MRIGHVCRCRYSKGQWLCGTLGGMTRTVRASREVASLDSIGILRQALEGMRWWGGKEAALTPTETITTKMDSKIQQWTTVGTRGRFYALGLMRGGCEQERHRIGQQQQQNSWSLIFWTSQNSHYHASLSYPLKHLLFSIQCIFIEAVSTSKKIIIAWS